MGWGGAEEEERKDVFFWGEVFQERTCSDLYDLCFVTGLSISSTDCLLCSVRFNVHLRFFHMDFLFVIKLSILWLQVLYYSTTFNFLLF